MLYSVTALHLTNFCTVMRCVRISFKLIFRTKHITAYSTMASALKSFDENFIKNVIVYSIKNVMNQSYYALWCGISSDVKRCYLES